eukprot:TRINITY_DN57962_c0_g1_i1.p1 TRINITY_DN57962_c0_g1~~TRINITY_DN57962_c0_g1_i1.p1  ORF type:complete len:350 (-),score=48.69 TRINITY_DN57962_c0_g1_i1:148-1197(-)
MQSATSRRTWGLSLSLLLTAFVYRETVSKWSVHSVFVTARASPSFLHLRRRSSEFESSESPGLALPDRSTSADAFQSSAGSVASIQLPLNDRFGLAYTCGKCDVRNAVSINRIAWTQGVVIATCRGCGARHLLADEGGLLDLTNDTGFKNVVQFIEAKGDRITKLDMSDRKVLEDLNLFVDRNGKLKLLDEELPAPPPAPPEALRSEEVTDASGPSAADQLGSEESAATQKSEDELDAPPLVVDLPVGVSSGDVLIVTSEFGLIHVPVPKQAYDGCKLELQGMLEAFLGKGHTRWIQAQGEEQWRQTQDWNVGDTVALSMPEGAVVHIRIPESALADSTLRIAYPVVVV